MPSGVGAFCVFQRRFEPPQLCRRRISLVSAVPLFNPICPLSTVLELFLDQHQFWPILFFERIDTFSAADNVEDLALFEALG